MTDTLDPALEAALDPKALDLAGDAVDLLDWQHNDGRELAATAVRAYLAAASPQAEIDRLREALLDRVDQYLRQRAATDQSIYAITASRSKIYRSVADELIGARADLLHPETPNGGQNG